MNDSPVVSEPIPRAARIRSRALLRWRVHGAETAAVALGTAAVGMQGARLGPWLTDDAGVALALARGLVERGPAAGGDATGLGEAAAGLAGPGWVQLLALGHRLGLSGPGGWYAGALALLCLAGALYAATGTVRVLRGRRAWPFALGTAGVLATCPPALAWLFSGTGGVLTLAVVALLVRSVAGAAVRGHLPRARTAVGAGLLAALGAWTTPAAAVLGAAYPAALLLAGRRSGGPAAAVRGAAVWAVVWAPACALLVPRASLAALPAVAYATALSGALLLAAGTAPRMALPVRLAGLTVGTVLLLPSWGLPPALALALCGAVFLAGRSPAARVVGAAALAGAAVLLGAAAPAANDGVPSPARWTALLAACAVAVTLALVAARRPGHRRSPVRVPETTARGAVAAVVAAAALATSLVQTAPPPAASALCFTDARYAQMFATYAERLGLKHSTVALASPGGVLLLGEQRVLDLRGRTDPKVAAARAAHDDAALRRHLFQRVRPEFVHVDAAEVARTGLTAERLGAHGYRPLLRQGVGGDFVHRSALTAPERLPELRSWARRTAASLEGSPVRSASGDRAAARPVEHAADIRPDERTCTR